MDAVNNCWRYHKCQIKKKHFYAYDNDALRWKNKPDTISNLQFRDLLLYWNTDEAKKISHNNKDNRLMLDEMHTLGRKSFAILRHELRQQDPDKQEPSQAKVYKKSRKRSSGRTYKTSCEKAKENIAKMDAVESSQHEDGNNCNDPYYEVIRTAKRKSRVHLYGSGVKKTDLKKKANKPDFIFPEEFISSVTTAVLAQIREANPEINIVIPDVLLQSTPNDASSAPNRISNHSGQSSKSGAACNQKGIGSAATLCMGSCSADCPVSSLFRLACCVLCSGVGGAARGLLFCLWIKINFEVRKFQNDVSVTVVLMVPLLVFPSPVRRMRTIFSIWTSPSSRASSIFQDFKKTIKLPF
uniref:Transposase n=1 Tax=Chenopodium quinoa TaxID=63459 RepID=A0A803N910_CHEQI